MISGVLHPANRANFTYILFEMRKLLFSFFCLTGFSLAAQATDSSYVKTWSVIDTLIIAKDLPQSALSEVNKLYDRAKREKQPAQAIKCLLYTLSLENRISSADINQQAGRLKKEINHAGGIAEKSILQTLLAKLYHRFYQEQRWIILNRKNTTAKDSLDLHTWSAEDLHKSIADNYTSALKQAELLYNIPLNSFNAVVLKGNDSTGIYKNNLLDLLATEALEYYKANENYSYKVSFRSKLTNPALLSTAAVFMHTGFDGKGQEEPQWKAILLYQQLMRMHAQTGNKNMLARYDIDRIEWINKNGQFGKKEQLYRSALNSMLKDHSNSTAAARPLYLLAALETDHAASYEPFGDTTYRYAFSNALKMIDTAKQLLGEVSWGKNGFHRLYHRITSVSLNGRVEKINLPGKPFRALISYRNLDTVYARIYKTDFKEFLHGDYENNHEKLLVGISPVESFSQALPVTTDYQQHNVEIKIAGLPQGDYFIVFSSGKEFHFQKDAVSTSRFSVSGLTYFRDRNLFFVRDLHTGKPIASAEVTIYTNSYRFNIINTERKRSLQFYTKVKTDRNGVFRLNNLKNAYAAYVLEIRSNNHYLVAETETMNAYEPDPAISDNEKTAADLEKLNRRLFFFTDRAIYRPGQLVQFKGIAITRDYHTKHSKLIESGETILVQLKNANYQIIDSIRCTLNEFGSIAGQFRLPETGLTGRFYIESSRFTGSMFSIRVEEYKRPDFVVAFDQVNAAYHIKDSIRINGNAKANAGNAISGAKISYTISRNIFFTGRSSYFPDRLANQVVTGETVTDAKGNFVIPFAPDIASDNPDDHISLHYTVEVMSTDKNGRTAQQQTRFSVFSHEMAVRNNAPVTLEKNSFTHITADVKDQFGKPYDAKVIIRLMKASVPDRLIRERLWQRPDQFIFSGKEFTAYFPNDEYGNESDYSSWTLTPVALQDSILQHGASKLLPLQPGLITAGVYKYELRAFDSAGHQVTVNQYVFVYDQANKQMPFPSYHLTNKTSAEALPGDTARFLNAGSTHKRYITRKIKRETDTGRERYQYLQVDNAEELLLQVEEKDRGSIIITDAYVAAGRLYTTQYRVHVPWNNKKLQINYTTYRKENEPGSRETWTVEVLNHAGKPAAAELLTAIYDASLDAFAKQNWMEPPLWTSFNSSSQFNSRQFETGWNRDREAAVPCVEEFYLTRNLLAGSGEDYWNYNSSGGMNNNPTIFPDVWMNNCAGALPMPLMEERATAMPFADDSRNGAMKKVVITGKDAIASGDTNGNEAADAEQVIIRRNFDETAFFLPQLQPDSSGNFRFSFSFPDAVTRWKWMSLAHTKDLAFGSNTTEIVTKKNIMVQPNAPRFLREGDHIEFSTRVANTSKDELSGLVTLELIDATTNRSVDGWFQNIFPQQHFTAGAGESVVIRFPLEIPYSYNKPVTWRVVAKAGRYSDGEENTLPVLTNRQLVTETLPLYLPNDTTQKFSFNKLQQHNNDRISNQSFTVEYTVNPIWNTVMAIPYLTGTATETAVQRFNQFYAAQLGAYILNRSPVIRTVFETLNKDSTVLQSNLEKNAALKQLLLEETPWVFAAGNETYNMQQLAQFFTRNTTNFAASEWISRLEEMQLPGGAFSWIKNGPADRYITQHILTGIGRLKRLGALSPDLALQLKPLLLKALNYADAAISRDYRERNPSKAVQAIAPLPYTPVEYLYIRSFFRDIAVADSVAYAYYYNRCKTEWQKQNSYVRAMIALITYRNKDEQWAIQQIVPSLLENSINDPQKGMFWKTTYTRSWFQSPVTHQSMMISCFEEINLEEKKYTRAINAMRTWLLLNKQTNNWKTDIATADACYALLLNGSNWLNDKRSVQIDLGKYNINSATQKNIAGSGYLKVNINPELVVPEMGHITVRVGANHQAQSGQPSYGGVYWQYFEELDKITPGSTTLSVSKALFLEKITATGTVLVPIGENEEISIGDKIVVQLTLRSDRDMEYIHLKDMRAAAMEPLNAISAYKWQEGLGYYESTRDTRSDFFIGYLPKGTYLFNYEVTATHAGRFSAGIATVQSMYAPEFSSHSAGMSIRIKE